jgi:hypothetical protein
MADLKAGILEKWRYFYIFKKKQEQNTCGMISFSTFDHLGAFMAE